MPINPKGKKTVDTAERARIAREARRIAREQREQDDKKASSLVVAHRLLRMKLSQYSTADRLRRECDEIIGLRVQTASTITKILPDGGDLAETSDTDGGQVDVKLDAESIFKALSCLQFAQHLDYDNNSDKARFLLCSRHILASLSTPETSFMSLCLKYSLKWTFQVKQLIPELLEQAVDEALQPIPTMKSIVVFLNATFRLLDSNTWGIASGDTPETNLRRKALTRLTTLLRTHVIESDMLLKLSEILVGLIARRHSLLTSSILQAVVSLSVIPSIQGIPGSAGWLEISSTIFAVPGLMHEVMIKSPMMSKILIGKQVSWICLSICNESSENFEKLKGMLRLRTSVFTRNRNRSSSTKDRHLYANPLLFITANLVHLSHLTMAAPTPKQLDLYVDTVTKFLDCLKSCVISKKSTIAHDHPILGWVAESLPQALLDVLPQVSKQIQLLWSPKTIATVFKPCLEIATINTTTSEKPLKIQEPRQKKFFARSIFTRASNAIKGKAAKVEEESSELRQMSAVCKLYTTASVALSKHQGAILSSISFSPGVVSSLWNYLPTLGPRPSMSVFLQPGVHVKPEFAENLLELLQLACQLATLLITVLNDEEIYETGESISVTMLTEISDFLIKYIFRAIWFEDDKANHPLLQNSNDSNASTSASKVLQHATRLLSVIYDCDCRRSFAPDGHWLVKSISTKKFEDAHDKERESDLKKETSFKDRRPAHDVLQRIPQVLPRIFRMRLFRDEISREKSAIAAARLEDELDPYITIRRAYLLTDGVREVPRLPVKILKDTFKIKFINKQGLDEAGIDQNGVFKEFLEESVQAAFNPDFGLFTTTTTNQIYPNPTACEVHPGDYIKLFEFVGILLGKAVYEGHLIELPLCQFFVNTLVGRHNTLDELPSLDPELSKNLAFVKSYEGDVMDLDLCFAVDEEVLGKIVTRDLMPAGSTIEVNNDNRILYCHLMADYRLNRQLKKYTEPFVQGFRKVVSPKWLKAFSAPEIQKLISGDSAKLDLDDLKRHTTYLGGYSSSHRVVKWLWQVVGEMDIEEQGRFLKFVTSCSKPPVLGFQTLHPPFAIRAVTDSSQEDSYTLGSSVVNFFRTGTNTERLPTSSTCFNLLKLPMYKSKRVLKEKLKYSIKSGAGFELS